MSADLLLLQSACISWPKCVPAAVYCRLECSCVMHLFLIFGSAIILALLGVGAAPQLPDACMPKAGVCTNPRWIACLPASVASAWTTPSLAFPGSSGTENRRAVHLGLPKDFMRFRMWLMLSSSSLSSVASLPGTPQDHLYLLNA